MRLSKFSFVPACFRTGRSWDIFLRVWARQNCFDAQLRGLNWASWGEGAGGQRLPHAKFLSILIYWDFISFDIYYIACRPPPPKDFLILHSWLASSFFLVHTATIPRSNTKLLGLQKFSKLHILLLGIISGFLLYWFLMLRMLDIIFFPWD